MKYIRTKDTIFEVVKDQEKVYIVKAKNNPANYYSKSKCQTDVINQADTIEKLCDQFVFVDDFYLHEHRVCHSFENAIALSKKHNVDIKTFRGAIWTNKGLIYVAKINDKGEMELL